MSFVKKTLKKAWNFVKKNWKTIVLVAAIAFTAGVATIGFAAFSGVTGVGSFMSAVGSTMWAGVAGTAGSMGLGGGATVPVTEATIAAGTAGTQVGLGAAMGAGGGHGLGIAGKKSAAAALEKTTELSATSMMPGHTTGNVLAQEGTRTAAQKTALQTATKEVAKKGMSDAAWKTAQLAIPAAGAFLAAAGQPSEFRDVDYHGTTKDGKVGPGVNALADPTAPGAEQIAAASAGAPGNVGDGLMDRQMNRAKESIWRPMAGQQGTDRNFDGTLRQEEGLMNTQGNYGYG